MYEHTVRVAGLQCLIACEEFCYFKQLFLFGFLHQLAYNDIMV